MSAKMASGKDTYFKHTPLDLSKAQIRLLRIGSRVSEGHGLVTCTVQTFNHSSLPSYNALSYVWGSILLQNNILLNGQLFIVRENLWHFLNDYTANSWGTDGTYWWIDQLCIDQESKSERNHQVKLMSSIYKDAYRVVSWLGRSNIDSSVSTDQHRNEIYLKKYWTRLWVVQEIMLAQRWTILYGQTSFDEGELFPGVNDPWSYTREFIPQDERLLPVLWVRQRSLLDFRGAPPQLVTCLINFAYLQSAEPHDKIYALLGLAADKEKVLVDYNLAPIDVFWAAMQSFDGNLIIDPSGIVRLAYDMGIVDEKCIVRNESFSYMSIDEIRIALKKKRPIKCTSDVLQPIEAQRLILRAGSGMLSSVQTGPTFKSIRYHTTNLQNKFLRDEKPTRK